MAPHSMVTSPANSDFIVRLLPSYFTMTPVNRSPFFITTWSANAPQLSATPVTSKTSSVRKFLLLLTRKPPAAAALLVDPL